MLGKSPVFVVRLIGGLGNQLFQIQYGLSLIKKWGGKLSFDDSFFLRAKQIHEVIVTGELVKKYDIITLGFFQLKIIRSFQRLAYKLGIRLPKFFSPYYIFSNDDNLHPSSGVYIVDGFWQSKEFLSEEFMEMMREQLLIQNHEEESSYVCVHIRRGDYLINSNASVLHMDYYQKAIELFKDKIENPRFCIFSDDEPWIKTVFFGDPRIIIMPTAKLSPLEVLKSMSSYKNYIIANSTLSWWAATLSRANRKMVILPKQWGNGLDSYNFSLDGWIQL